MTNRYGMDVIRGILTAETPVHSGGNEKTGSVSLLNRQRYVSDDGPIDVPFISGNAVRGYLRRLAFTNLLDDIDYQLDLDRPAERKVYHALFTGGVLEQVDKKNAGIINLELKRKLYDTIPYARIFGFAWGNQMIESTLKVGQIIPICTELSGYIPIEFTEKPKHSVYNLISQTFQTRKDDLSGVRNEDEAVHQMLIDYETFLPGTKFYHDLRIEDATPLDMSALHNIIRLWRMKPYIGAKSGIGMGRLNIQYDIDIDTDLYNLHISDNTSKIENLLNELCGRLHG